VFVGRGVLARSVARRRHDLLVGLSLTLLILIAHAQSLARLTHGRWVNDWTVHAKHHAFVRIALRDFGQLPLWSPWFGGGFPMYAHPEWPALNPLSWPAIFLGDVAGIKIKALLIHLIGVLGLFYLLRRVLHLSLAASLLGALAMAFAAWFPGRMMDGGWALLYAQWAPLLAALFFRATRVGYGRHLIAASLLLAWVSLDGALMYPVLALFLGLLAVTSCCRRRCRKLTLFLRPWGVAVVIIALSIAFSTVRVLPIARLMWCSGAQELQHLTVYDIPLARQKPAAFFLKQLVTPGPPATHDSADIIYVGWVAALVAMAGVVLSRGRMRRWAILFLIFLLLAAGRRSPIPLYDWLHHLPVFSALGSPDHYFNCFLPIFVVVGVAFFAAWLGRLRKGVVGNVVLAIALTVTMLPETWRVQREYSARPFPLLPKSRDFFQLFRTGQPRNAIGSTILANDYVALCANVGVINWYSSLVFGERAVPRFFVNAVGQIIPNPAYRGEAWMENGNGTARLSFVSPNRLIIEYAALEDEFLVVNQNWHSGWRTAGRPVVSRTGLLAVPVSAGSGAVCLDFVPVDFFVAAGLSLVALAGALSVHWWRLHRRRRRRLSLDMV